ncbi:MAG: glycine--tRNA ligase subunit beta, partial [bacterium]|nr:glycine--tRNA ligase subunit beta [bacterium]
RSAGVELDTCEVREVKGVEYYFAVVEKIGGSTRDVLPKLLSKLVDQISWPVSMRWSSGTRRWVRPLHGALAIFDGRVLDGGVDLGRGARLEFGDSTSGHRFLSNGPIKVTSFAEYEAKLRNGYVLLRSDEREQSIRADLDAAASQAGLKVLADEGLLKEVTGLVEWPVILLGRIDEGFMDLPGEVLWTWMRTH